MHGRAGDASPCIDPGMHCQTARKRVPPYKRAVILRSHQGRCQPLTAAATVPDLLRLHPCEIAKSQNERRHDGADGVLMRLAQALAQVRRAPEGPPQTPGYQRREETTPLSSKIVLFVASGAALGAYISFGGAFTSSARVSARSDMAIPAPPCLHTPPSPDGRASGAPRALLDVAYPRTGAHQCIPPLALHSHKGVFTPADAPTARPHLLSPGGRASGAPLLYAPHDVSQRAAFCDRHTPASPFPHATFNPLSFHASCLMPATYTGFVYNHGIPRRYASRR